MPPRWALGFLRSTRHFADTAELLRLAATFREKQLPCDALVLLSSYGDMLGLEPRRRPSRLSRSAVAPTGRRCSASFAGSISQIVTHEYPVLHQNSPLFAEAESGRATCCRRLSRVAPADRPSTDYQEGQRYLDFLRPGGRPVVVGAASAADAMRRRGLVARRRRGPAAPHASTGGHAFTIATICCASRRSPRARRGDPETAGLPALPFRRAGHAALRRRRWSGDINNRFADARGAGLGLNVGMSGVPYWGTDIGGYYPGRRPSGELFARWFQFGAFCPIFRAHGGSGASTCPGRTDRRSRRSAGAISSCAIG